MIIATGNHFLFDAIAGAAVYGVAYGAVRVVRRLSVREPAEELPLAA